MTEEEKLWKSEIAEKAILNYKDMPFHFHTVDRSLLRVANKAVGKGKKMVINYPLHRCDLIVPLTLEACYVSSLTGQRSKVLLITNKLLVREFYEDVIQAGAKVANVLFPIGMVSRKGDIKPIYESLRGLSKKHKNFIKDSTVFLTSSLKYLPSYTKDIGVIIFDLSQNYEPESIDYLLRWAGENSIKSVIFVISESQTGNIDHFNSLGIPIWGWTPAMLKKEFEKENVMEESHDAPFCRSAIEVKRLTEGIKREGILIEPPELFKNMLFGSYKFYRECWKVYKVKSSPLLKEALFTYSRILKIIERMTAPLKIVEEEEDTSWGVLSLRKRTEKLRMIQQKLTQEEPIIANLLSSAVLNIERLRDWLLDNGNPKFEKAISIIKEKGDKSICFAFLRACDKNATLCAFEEELGLDEEALNEKGIYLATYTELDEMTEWLDFLYIPGAVPEYAKFLLRNTQAEAINFLIYPTEMAMLQREIEEDNEIWNSEFSVDERAYAIGNLLDTDHELLMPRMKKEYSDIKPPEAQTKIITELEKETEEEKIGDENVKEFFSEMLPENVFAGQFSEDLSDQDDDSGIDYDSEEAILSDEGIEINAVKIDFDDGESIVVSESKRLPVFLEFKDKVIYREANKISRKDLVVIINKGTKDTFAQSLFKVLHKLPSMKKTVLYAQSWVLMLRKEVRKNNDSPSDVLYKLQEEGSQLIEPTTIAHWLLGETIGPRDKKDILRIGKIYENKFIQENFPKISEAVSNLRGIHQRLVRRLGLLIPKAGVKAIKGDMSDDDMIAPELGLHVEDFHDAITLKRTEKLLNIKANYNILNKLIKTEELEGLEEIQNDKG